ncbi:type VI secretion system baseplate subunit TssF [Derxia gummosa]|uniref:Type VI secretion system baseplate subunit TssF n=1 Tax=Derxia gummosa DSM 723 TaxID=1121388 RepID=A0A8B6X4C8_9BURK|nr:type VI secretion system baseplate subunit TssF [Derxia gummosa]
MRVSDDLLSYYERELVYLHDRGAEFARRYPRVAGRLGLGGAESPDPHTERLIEAQAFLAARVHRDLDREFPQIAAALLDNLCPTLAQPVPAMSVAAFALDPSQGKITAGLPVPRHTVLVAHGAGGEACRLRTAWDSLLWPVQIAETRLVDGRELRLRLRCDAGNDLAELELDRLRLHLHGDWTQTMPLYDLLASGVAGISLHTADGVQRLAARHWRELGFGADETVLPVPPHADPAYALLQEYFAFARKFHFFEIDGLRGRLGAGTECEIGLHLRPGVALPARIDPAVLRTGCVPVVNLFPRTSEPMRTDARRHDYLLCGDRERPEVEVHSIVAVHLNEPDAARDVVLPPFAALDADAAEAGLYWSARREPAGAPEARGSEMWLSFVDARHGLANPGHAVLHADLLCSSPRLAEQLPPGARLQAEGLSSALHANNLYLPSAQRPAPLAAQAMWQLVSLLRLNHGSLFDGDDDGERLRALLRLFGDGSAHDLAQVRGLRRLCARPGIAHVGHDAWRGHRRGTDIEIEFDEEAFVGGSPLLLSAVLARFFGLYTTINSFARLTVRRRDEVWQQWPPISGRQALL